MLISLQEGGERVQILLQMIEKGLGTKLLSVVYIFLFIK
jgi:hypothetical protein